MKDVPHHLSDLKDPDDSIFLSESKCYSIFLHLFYKFQLILYNTNQLISNNIYKDNRFSGCVYPIFVLDLSTHACHQKDSKIVCFVSPLSSRKLDLIE